MTKELYERLTKASSALCSYCDNDECEACQVTRLMDDAYVEAVEAGIVEGEESEEEDEPEEEYEVAFVVRGYVDNQDDEIGNLECNGTIFSEDRLGYEIRDGRMYYLVPAENPKEAYTKGLDLLKSEDFQKLHIVDTELEHVSRGDQYWYMPELS